MERAQRTKLRFVRRGKCRIAKPKTPPGWRPSSGAFVCTRNNLRRSRKPFRVADEVRFIISHAKFAKSAKKWKAVMERAQRTKLRFVRRGKCRIAKPKTPPGWRPSSGAFVCTRNNLRRSRKPFRVADEVRRRIFNHKEHKEHKETSDGALRNY